MISDQRYIFDKVFQDVMTMINIRYIVKGYQEKEKVFFKNSNILPEEIDKKVVKYKGVIICESYKDISFIYE